MDVAELFEKAEKLRGTENLDEAVEKYREVIAIAEDSFFKAESLHMIGLIYYQQGKLEEAENYLKEAEDSFVKLKNDAMRGAVLRDLATAFVAGNDLDKAEALLLESISLLENSERRGHLGISKVKLGSVYQKQGRFDQAERELLEGIAAIKESDDSFFESSAYFSLAKLQKEQKQIGEAKLSAERALALLEKITVDEEHKERKNEIRQFIAKLV